MRTKRASLLLALALGAAACASSGDEAVNPPTMLVSADACAAMADSQELFELLEAPFDLSATDVKAEFARGRRAVQRMIEGVERGDVRASLERLLEAREVMDPVLIAELSENAELLESIGVRWQHVVLGSSVVSQEAQDAYAKTRDGSLAWGINYVDAACDAPEQLQPARQDLERDIESGTIVYERFDDEDRGLLAMSSRGGRQVAIDPPAGWDDLDDPSVGPDGRTITAVVRRFGDAPSAGLAVGTLHTPFEVVYESPDVLSCPTEAGDGTILATRLGRDGGGASLLAIEDGVATALALPLLDLSCADQLPSGELVVSSAQIDPSIPGNVVLTGPVSQAIRTLYEPAHCRTIASDLSPDGTHELVVQSCFDRRASGLYSVDVRDGSARQIVAGPAAVASWSPMGEWIAFAKNLSAGTAPKADRVSVWLVRRDGHGLRRLTDEATSFAAWVADEL